MTNTFANGADDQPATEPRTRLPNSQARLGRRKKLVFATLTTAIFLTLVYFVSLWYRADHLYRHLRTTQRGWRPAIHRQDPVLGFAPIGGVSADEWLSSGLKIPTRLDSRGFRIPFHDRGDSINQDRHLLALGCSFTFGAACRAEDTFPQLVADRLKLTCHNGGVCSYGLSQMLLRGLPLIRQLRPTLVLIQYSPWLVDRAITGYAPSYYGLQPVPYLARSSDRTTDESARLLIEHPAFRRYTIDTRRFADSEPTAGNYLRFVAASGIPLLIHDDLLHSLTWARQRIGHLRPPMTNRQAVVDQVYSAFARVCRKNGATLVVVILDKGIPPGPRERLDAARGAITVDAHDELVSALPVAGPVAYQKMYGHWWGEPARLVDEHPNERAHRSIADSILAAVPQLSDGN